MSKIVVEMAATTVASKVTLQFPPPSEPSVCHTKKACLLVSLCYPILGDNYWASRCCSPAASPTQSQYSFQRKHCMSTEEDSKVLAFQGKQEMWDMAKQIWLALAMVNYQRVHDICIWYIGRHQTNLI